MGVEDALEVVDVEVWLDDVVEVWEVDEELVLVDEGVDEVE